MILDLKYYGSPILRKKSAPVKEVNDEIRQLVQNLIETVFHCNGVGLAAPQVGVPYRIFIVCLDNGEDSEGWPILCPPKVYINPILSKPSEELGTYADACLSIPGVREEVARPLTVVVEYMDLEGNTHTEETFGWRARAVMHENDHLNGVFFIDRLLSSKRRKIIEPTLRAIKKKYT